MWSYSENFLLGATFFDNAALGAKITNFPCIPFKFGLMVFHELCYESIIRPYGPAKSPPRISRFAKYGAVKVAFLEIIFLVKRACSLWP